MDEKDEIIEEPKVETPDSGNKKKKRRPRKKKEEPKEEENEEQNEPKENPNIDNPLENLTVNVSFQFLMTIRDILINISPRVNWNAQELLPVGMVLRDLNNISANVNEQFSNIAEGNTEGETEGDVEDDDDDPVPESEVIN